MLPMLLHARGAYARKARVGSPRPLLTRWTDGITSPSSSTIFSSSPIPIFFTLLGLIIQPPPAPAPAPPVPSAIAAECEMVANRCRRWRIAAMTCRRGWRRRRYRSAGAAIGQRCRWRCREHRCRCRWRCRDRLQPLGVRCGLFDVLSVLGCSLCRTLCALCRTLCARCRLVTPRLR